MSNQQKTSSYSLQINKQYSKNSYSLQWINKTRNTPVQALVNRDNNCTLARYKEMVPKNLIYIMGRIPFMILWYYTKEFQSNKFIPIGM